MQTRKDEIPGYLYALDGLRAVSLIFIVMFHTWQQSWMFCNIRLTQNRLLFNFEIVQRYGFVAIDSFYVLSGFCLFYPIAREMFGESKFGGWKNFFKKRIRRLYPAYIAILLIAIFVPKFASTGNDYNPSNVVDVLKQLIPHLLFIHNFSAKTLDTMINTAWTMPVEVHFYLMLPLLCIPFRKKPVLACIGMSVFAAALRLLLIMKVNISSHIISAITPAYFDVFGMGMLSAYFVVYVRNKVSVIGKLKPLMTIISALCVYCVIGYIYWMRDAAFPQGYTADVYFRFLYRGIFSLFIALFLFSTCFSYKFWERGIWGNRFFVFLSSISYPVYLFHQNMYIFLKGMNIPYSTVNPVMNDRSAMEGMVFLCLATSVVLGYVLTRYVEKPIVKYGVCGAFVKLRDNIKEKLLLHRG